MDLERLSEFILITEEGSFKAAAARLGIAPSVLSVRFSGFENAPGVSLFERNARRIVLTESDRILLREGREILDGWICEDNRIH